MISVHLVSAITLQTSLKDQPTPGAREFDFELADCHQQAVRRDLEARAETPPRC
jgi:hypothetical protein